MTRARVPPCQGALAAPALNGGIAPLRFALDVATKTPSPRASLPRPACSVLRSIPCLLQADFPVRLQAFPDPGCTARASPARCHSPQLGWADGRACAGVLRATAWGWARRCSRQVSAVMAPERAGRSALSRRRQPTEPGPARTGAAPQARVRNAPDGSSTLPPTATLARLSSLHAWRCGTSSGALDRGPLLQFERFES